MITILEAFCKRKIKKYGKDKQLTVACEECAELIQAITKIKRYGDEPELIKHLAEEIGDVEIMIYQIKLMFDDLENLVDEWKQNKIKIR